MSEKPKNQENAKNQKNTKNTKTRKHTSNNQGCGITSNVWDLVSCVLSIVECFILKGKSKSESFQKNKSGSRGWTCLVLSKALHLCVFGWHHKSFKIRIFRSAGVTDFFGERKCLSRKWSFCRDRTLDSKHKVSFQRWRAWPRSPVFYKFLAPPKSPKTTNFEIPGPRICTHFYELITFWKV